MRGTLFGGFPWNLPGTSWLPGGAISQLASVGGVYWLTLLTWFVMTSPAALVDTRATQSVTIRAVPAIISVALIGFGWALGAQRLTDDTEFTQTNILLMDAGVPQTQKFDRNGESVLVRYLELLRDTPSQANDIVVWPEGALPNGLLPDTRALDLVAEFLGPRYLIVGSTRLDRTSGDRTIAYNSLAVMRRGVVSADLVALYDKYRLVPFGELAASQIIPFGEHISGLLPGPLQRRIRAGFQAGAEPTVLLPQEIVPPFIPLICYEGLFPEMVRTASPQREAAAWIVVISNDAWFQAPLRLGPAQHYAQHRYRAIESGLPLARVATLGVTAMIDGYGRQVAQGNPVPGDPDGWRASVVRTQLPTRLAMPLYQRFGETFFWLTLVLMSGLAFLTWRR